MQVRWFFIMLLAAPLALSACEEKVASKGERLAYRTARTGDQNFHRARFAATRELFDVTACASARHVDHFDASPPAHAIGRQCRPSRARSWSASFGPSLPAA
jgi:hypothetical protein